jgi:hypothetical protein
MIFLFILVIFARTTKISSNVVQHIFLRKIDKCIYHFDIVIVTEPPPPKQGFVSQDPIGGFSMKQECTNTHISIQYHDIQVIKSLLHINCYVLELTKDEAKRCFTDILEFCGSIISHDKHTLFTLEESGPPRTTYTYESQ